MSTQMVVIALVVALLAGLLQLVIHALTLLYLPHMGRVTRYTLGTLAMMLPASVLLVVWGDWVALLVYWLSIGASGAAVLGGYKLRAVWQVTTEQREAQEREHARDS